VADRIIATTYIGREGTDGRKTLSGSANTLAVYNRALSNVEIYNSYLALTTNTINAPIEIGDANGAPALSVASDGRVNVTKLGQSSNVVPWPPAAMVSFFTTINNGNYIASSSSYYGANPPWYAFDKTNTQWASAYNTPSDYSTTIPYNANSTAPSTTDVNGTVYLGAWIQIQLPVPITLSYYIFQGSYSVTTWGPARFVLLGSRDGINWFLVDSQSGLSWSTSYQTKTCTPQNTQSYSYFRYVCLQVVSNSGNTEVGELTLYGTADTAQPLTVAQPVTLSYGAQTASLTGISGDKFVPQDFSSSGLNIPAYVVSNTATVANTVAFSSFGPFAGEGSVYFPGGTGAYVNFPSSAVTLWPGALTSLGSGTIEMWVYLTKYNANQTTLIARGTTSGTFGWWLNISSSGALSFQTYGGAFTTSGGTVALNAWNHVAVSAASNYVSIFLNGTLVGTPFTYSGTLTGSVSDPILISNPSNANYTINGYISNMRLTIGQALYTTSFTPPTAPLQPIQGTTQAGLPYGTVLLLRNAPAPGRVLTSKFGGANSGGVLAFPPAAMTGYSTALNSGYGQGTYVASASVEFSASYLAWYAFDQNASNSWLSSANYSASSPFPYTGSTTTVDVTGTSYAGDWLQIQMPSSIVLSGYTLTTFIGNKFFVMGSRDGTNWSLVDQRSNAGSGTFTGTVASGQAFTYFRIVFNQAGGARYAQVNQWTLNGTIEGPSISADGRLGVGVSNPVQALEVAGSALFTGRVGIGSTMPATGTGIYLWSNTSGTASQIFAQGQVYPSNGASVNRDMLSILNNNGGSVNARINLWGDVFNVGPQIDYGAALHRFMHQNLTTFIGGFSNGNLLTGGATTISVDANGYIIRGATSDQRLKSNIEPMTQYGLATVSNLNPVSFEWNDDAKVKFGDGLQYGLIAQDVQQAFPWAVSESQDEQKTLTIDYPKFTPVLINAIKELQARVVALEQRLASSS
jgi:hypothetical protein